ncbi:MAG: PRC-barrel domain-containing protein [Candidatus Marsarchaeota archaeon]|jgi:sporulation protein YlmC with PRC-barrel domain|nr:PRC-barrel domain-containing protein [Candidatus Marsarchaeota archaeon]
MMLSELYGKQIITNDGRKLGFVEEIVLNVEDWEVSDLLLVRIDDLAKAKPSAAYLSKNSVSYKTVKNVSQTIIVGSQAEQRSVR